MAIGGPFNERRGRDGDRNGRGGVTAADTAAVAVAVDRGGRGGDRRGPRPRRPRPWPTPRARAAPPAASPAPARRRPRADCRDRTERPPRAPRGDRPRGSATGRRASMRTNDDGDAAPRSSANIATRVIVAGATGRVGRVMLDGLPAQPDLSVVGGFGSANALAELQRLAPEADVLVDFTTGARRARACWPPRQTPACTSSAARVVCPPDALDELDAALQQRRQRGGLWAANFAIGGALMMYFARVAARFMDAAEVIELHHDKKVDAPSGTAVQTARDIRAGARQRPARPAGRALDARGLARRGPRRRTHPQRAACQASTPTRRCCSARSARC